MFYTELEKNSLDFDNKYYRTVNITLKLFYTAELVKYNAQEF